MIILHIVIISLIIYMSINTYLAFAKGTHLKRMEKAKKRTPFLFIGPMNNPKIFDINYKISSIIAILMLLFIEFMLITVGDLRD